MRPSRHFRQHHDVEAPQIDTRAFRPAWRVRPRLEGLLHAGDITLAEYAAAIRYRRRYELAYASAIPAASMTPSSGTPDGDRMTQTRLDALAELAAVERRIGPVRVWWLQACVVYDLAWRELAGAHRIHHRTARKRSIAAIRALVPKNSLDTE